MPDKRQHRGPHPDDHQLFAKAQLPALRSAASDLSWLLSRGYASTSALKIVGDRYQLKSRQRVAVARCACSDQSVSSRTAKELEPASLTGRALWIDGYNVITSLEAALAGGVILHARDGCYRDMASMHGSYRRVAETLAAIEHLGAMLVALRVDCSHWLLDQPVSNSGRLKKLLDDFARQRNWPWQVELVSDPDRILSRTSESVATSDSGILDKCSSWFGLSRYAIERNAGDCWMIDLSGSP